MKILNTLRFTVSAFLIFACCTITQAQCTLAVDSTHITEVTCNNQSNGAITIYTGGAHGAVTYSNGAGGTPLLTQSFSTSNSVVSTGSTGSESVWWSPGTCNNSPPWVYTSAQGCPAGSAVFQGTTNSFEGCFLRSPNVNMNGINTVVITMDVTNNASGASDYLSFSVWVDNNYPTLPFTVNGVATTNLYLGTARNCVPVTVTIDLSSLPTNSRSDFLFYIQANCENATTCSGFMAAVDNVSIAPGAPTQTSNIFTGLAAGSYTFTVTDSAGCTATDNVTITQPNVLSAVPSSTAVTTVGGSNGTAIANPTGGTTAYSYTWNSNPVQQTDTATGLTAGNYDVTITDANGCSATASVTVGAPSCTGFSVNATSTDITCNGNANGTIVVTATGGHSPYQYELNTLGYQSSSTFSNLAPGTYTVHVLDTVGCTATYGSTITISQPGALTISMQITNVTTIGGHNGSATAVVTGGTGPYYPHWNTNLSLDSLPAGTYCVAITDSHGCTDTACGVVSQPSCTGLAAAETALNILCYGGNTGSITVAAAGGTAPYLYALNNGVYQSASTFTGLSAGTYSVDIKDTVGCADTLSGINITQPSSALGVSITTTADTVVGGSTGTATANPTGGTSPYYYAWNPAAQTIQIINNLSAGNYCVTVTDHNGCTATACGIVLQPNCGGLSASTAITQVSCNGMDNGKIGVHTTGGASPYQYELNSGSYQAADSFINLSAGNYTVTVKDDSGCSVVLSNITISQPATLVINVTTTAVSNAGASDGSAIAVVTGGTNPDTLYQWSTGATTDTINGLATGTYCITVVDHNGCTASACGTVNAPGCSGFVIDSVKATNDACYGDTTGSIQVYAGGGSAPINYSINNGATYQSNSLFNNLAASPYSVQAKDTNGCVAAYSNNPVNITQPAAFIPPVSLNGETVSTNIYVTYQWYLNGSEITGANEQTYTATQTGLYSVAVTDTAGCSGTSASIHVTVSGIGNLTQGTSDISIFPNPFSDGLNIKIEGIANNAVIYLEMYDLCGRKLMQLNGAMSEFTLPTSTLAPGTYLIGFTINGETTFRKVIKQ